MERAWIEMTRYGQTLVFPVEVLDTRRVYGRVEHLITPVGGSGEAWVHGDRVVASPKPAPPVDVEFPVVENEPAG